MQQSKFYQLFLKAEYVSGELKIQPEEIKRLDLLEEMNLIYEHYITRPQQKYSDARCDEIKVFVIPYDNLGGTTQLITYVLDYIIISLLGILSTGKSIRTPGLPLRWCFFLILN